VTTDSNLVLVDVDSGNSLTGRWAYELGMAYAFVPPEELLPAARALAHDIMGADPAIMRPQQRRQPRGSADCYKRRRHEAERRCDQYADCLVVTRRVHSEHY
jgi:enoyl-CoA hydratase/carnithine racemase